MLFNTGCSQFA